MNPIGARLLYRYEWGDVIEAHFETENIAHWHALAGELQGHGGTETYLADRLGPGVYLFTWVEDNGVVMTNVSDFNAMTFVSSIAQPRAPHPNPRIGRGTIEIKQQE